MTMEFPPNLDDGEHYYWLPSDIFPDDEYEYEVSLPPAKNLFNSCMPPKFPTPSPASDFSCVALHPQSPVFQIFSAYLHSSPRLERLVPPSSFGSVEQPGKVVGISESSRSLAFSHQSGPLHMYNNVLQSPPYSQVQRVFEIRSRQLQLQQYHHPFLPTIPSRGHHGGFVVRTPPCRGTGTGVFLPRIAPSSTTTPNQTRARVKSKPSKKQAAGGKNTNRQEEVQGQASPMSERKSMSGFGLRQSADFHYQLSPPDMGLPPEWTY